MYEIGQTERYAKIGRFIISHILTPKHRNNGCFTFINERFCFRHLERDRYFDEDRKEKVNLRFNRKEA